MSGTVFCDIDGVIFHHRDQLSNTLLMEEELLPGVREKFDEWEKCGMVIVLTTGRPESMRQHTQIQLENCGLYYSHLIMGLPSPRYLYNDKRDGAQTAFSFNLDRNSGF